MVTQKGKAGSASIAITCYMRKRMADIQNPPSADEIRRFDEILKAGPIRI